jgi:hypothetical protein
MPPQIQRHLAADIGKPAFGLFVILQEHQQARSIRKVATTVHIRQKRRNGQHD